MNGYFCRSAKSHLEVGMEELNAWSVLSLITSGNLDSLKGLVAQYGSKAILMDNDPDELTTLHHASRAGQLAIVT